jgi:hypothetical protein
MSKKKNKYFKNLVDHFFNVLDLTCKDSIKNISEIIEDNRTEYLVKYKMEFIILEAILLFIFGSKSRGKANYKFNLKQTIIKNVNRYLKTDNEKFSHFDNVEKIFKKLKVGDLENFLVDIIIKLIRDKKINSKSNLLLGKYYLVAIDMTQTQEFKSDEMNGKKIEGLLSQKINENGDKVWFRRVVEAKLILLNKCVISLKTEFVRNDDSVDGKYIKQDCELKAAYRLFDKLKKTFPRLYICLLLDGLYPNQTIFGKCRDYNWKYIMTLKEDKLPKLYNRYKDLKAVKHFQEKKKIVDKTKTQRFKYIDNLSYKDFPLTVFEMREYSENKGLQYYNMFITNIEVTKDNIYYIGVAGRLRWKEEHAFHNQKNLFFNLKHVYSTNENASQCWHVILQIADLILQFMMYSYNNNGTNYVYKIFGTLQFFFEQIYVSFESVIFGENDSNYKKQLILMQPLK